MTLTYQAEPVLEALRAASVVVIDTETSSLEPFKDGRILAGLGVRPLGGPSYYFPVRHGGDERLTSLHEVAQVVEALRGKTLVFHNAKFDLAVLYQEGFDLSGEDVVDTWVLARLCYEDLPRYALKELGYSLLHREDGKEAEAGLKRFMRSAKLETYDQVPPSVIWPYATTDLELTEGLYELLMPMVERFELGDLLDLEKKLTPALFRAEQRGCVIDQVYVRSELERMRQVDHDLSEEAYRQAGRRFNIDSPADVGKAFEGLGISSPLMTSGGRKKREPKQSWSKVALAQIDHPLCDLVTQVRAVRKLCGSYYEKFLELVDDGGAIHPDFWQAGTRTGRLSCHDPNLQNVPRWEGFTASLQGALVEMAKRKRMAEMKHALDADGMVAGEAQAVVHSEFERELYGKVRGAFVPRPGFFLLFADWSQIELRIFADYSKEQELLRVFDLGLDVHRLTALAAFGSLPEDEESQQFKWLRNMGKQIAFGLLYGMGIELLAKETGRSREEAQQFMDSYFARFPHAKAFINLVLQCVMDRGYLKNRWGRRRNLAADRAYVGVNFLVQGTAADLMKDAIVRVDRRLQGLKSGLLITIHDELVIEVAYDEVEQVVPAVVEEMTRCDRLQTKLRVDLEWSPTRWSEKSPLTCDACRGTGQLLNINQDELLRMMYRGDEEGLAQVKVKPCDACATRGWVLTPVLEHRVNENDQAGKQAVPTSGVGVETPSRGG